jgi:putative sterol carrier protein
LIETRIDDIKKQKKTLKSLLTNAENRLQNLTNSGTKSREIYDQFKETIQKHNDRLDGIVSDLAQLDNTDKIIEGKVQDMSARLDDLALKLKGLDIANIDAPNANSGMKFEAPKLKAIKLPEFDGCHSKWQTFWESFRVIIDEQLTLADSTKLQYLKSALRSSALEEVKHIAITGPN